MRGESQHGSASPAPREERHAAVSKDGGGGGQKDDRIRCGSESLPLKSKGAPAFPHVTEQ